MSWLWLFSKGFVTSPGCGHPFAFFFFPHPTPSRLLLLWAETFSAGIWRRQGGSLHTCQGCPHAEGSSWWDRNRGVREKDETKSRECHWHTAQELTRASRTSNDDNELQARKCLMPVSWLKNSLAWLIKKKNRGGIAEKGNAWTAVKKCDWRMQI